MAANSVCPYLLQKVFTHGDMINYRSLFLVPLAIATISAIVLALFFHPPARKVTVRK